MFGFFPFNMFNVGQQMEIDDLESSNRRLKQRVEKLEKAREPKREPSPNADALIGAGLASRYWRDVDGVAITAMIDEGLRARDVREVTPVDDGELASMYDVDSGDS